MYICYCLLRVGGNSGPLTYVGCTNNFPRRIRQHNSEIKGGAICTTRACNQGAKWHPILFAKGFTDNKEALSFEWWWKFESRKISAPAQEKRLRALDVLLKKTRFSHIVKDEVASPPVEDHNAQRSL